MENAIIKSTCAVTGDGLDDLISSISDLIAQSKVSKSANLVRMKRKSIN